MKKLLIVLIVIFQGISLLSGQYFYTEDKNGNEICFEFISKKNKTVAVSYNADSVYNIDIDSTIIYEDEFYTVVGVKSYMGSDFFSEACKCPQKVNLANSITKINYGAFSGCFNIEEVNLPPLLDSISISAFEDCYSLSHVSLPKSLMYIGNSAFRHCLKLKSIVIPNRIKVIEGLTFSYCTSLCFVTLSDSLEYIKSSAFAHCQSLKSIEMPETIELIDMWAFRNCKKLQEVILHAKQPPMIYIKTFEGTPRKLVVYVPNSCVTAYKTHKYWGRMNIRSMSELLN